MREPSTGADLKHFLCAKNWMSNSIPEFTNPTDTFSDILEEVYKMYGKKTRRAAQKV